MILFVVCFRLFLYLCPQNQIVCIMRNISFKTLEGVYIVKLDAFRSKLKEGYYGRKERKFVNSYLIYNATNKTSKIIDYEEVWAPTFDSELRWFVIKENEKFIVAENGKCFYMDSEGFLSQYEGDIHSMRKRKTSIIPQECKIEEKPSSLENWDEYEPITLIDIGGYKLTLPDGEIIVLPFKIKERIGGNYLIYDDIKTNKSKYPERKYGIVSKIGKIVVEPKFDSIINNFKQRDKLYQVKLDDKYGVINENGEVILPPKYGWIEDCDGDFAIIDDGTKLINVNTEEIIYTSEVKMNSIIDGWIAVLNRGILSTNGTFYPISLKKIDNVRSSNDWWGVEWGKLYDRIGSKVCNGLIPVYDSKRGYGYVNLDSIEVIRCKYNEIHYFTDGRAKVRYDTDFGYIDTKGNIIVKNGIDEVLIPNRYDWAYDFDGTISVVQQGRLYGCVDSNLNELLPCVFYSANDVKKAYQRILLLNNKVDYQEQLLDLEPPQPYEENGLYGFKRADGKCFCPPIFRSAHFFIEGRALVSFGGKYGYLNEKLEFAIPPIYNSAEDFSEGLALVNNRDYINKNGECVIHTDHHIEKLSSFCGGKVICEYNYCQPGRENDSYEITKRVSWYES